MIAFRNYMAILPYCFISLSGWVFGVFCCFIFFSLNIYIGYVLPLWFTSVKTGDFFAFLFFFLILKFILLPHLSPFFRCSESWVFLTQLLKARLQNTVQCLENQMNVHIQGLYKFRTGSVQLCRRSVWMHTKSLLGQIKFIKSLPIGTIVPK